MRVHHTQPLMFSGIHKKQGSDFTKTEKEHIAKQDHLPVDKILITPIPEEDAWYATTWQDSKQVLTLSKQSQSAAHDYLKSNFASPTSPATESKEEASKPSTLSPFVAAFKPAFEVELEKVQDALASPKGYIVPKNREPFTESELLTIAKLAKTNVDALWRGSKIHSKQGHMVYYVGTHGITEEAKKAEQTNSWGAFWKRMPQD